MRRSSKRALLAAIQVCAGLIAIAAAGWSVANSSLFDMRSLAVTGNVRLPHAEVRRLSGLSSTTNVLWVSPRSIERRLLRSPWIRSAHVSRSLPAHVSLVVRERSPVAVLVGPRDYLVAADGTVLAEAKEPFVLPTFQLPGGPVAVGRVVDPRSPPLAALASAPPQLRKLVQRATDGQGETLSLVLRDSTRIVYGKPSQGRAKAEAVIALLEWARRNAVRPAYIDVRAPDAPALLPG